MYDECINHVVLFRLLPVKTGCTTQTPSNAEVLVQLKLLSCRVQALQPTAQAQHTLNRPNVLTTVHISSWLLQPLRSVMLSTSHHCCFTTRTHRGGVGTSKPWPVTISSQPHSSSDNHTRRLGLYLLHPPHQITLLITLSPSLHPQQQWY